MGTLKKTELEPENSVYLIENKLFTMIFLV